jgi:ABC-type transport system involved in cytochrome c biogenesis permease subunit
MMTDRTLLWLAQGFYAASAILAFWRLRAKESDSATRRFNYVFVLCGFALHTTGLFLRGQALGRCPLTNLFETQVFVAWAAVLFYLLIGPSYRVSFLGAFTSPVVLALCLVALLAPIDVARPEPQTRTPWVEFHAGVAILAYGAFALAFVMSAMYLVQERQLKSRHPGWSFLLLPPVEQLDVINCRLLVMGFVMLTAGMIGGAVSYRIVGHWTNPKLVWAVAVWVLYGALLAARAAWSVRGRKMALATMLLFALVLAAYWGVSLLS